MTAFLIRFDDWPSRDDALALELEDRLRDDEVMTLWVSRGSPERVGPALHRLLLTGQVRSAALLVAVPPPERRWVAMEWPGKLAVGSVGFAGFRAR